jgi:hypothetical protein
VGHNYASVNGDERSEKRGKSATGSDRREWQRRRYKIK